MNEIYDFHKKFWDNYSDSILPDSSPQWVEKYVEEILEILGNPSVIVDAGCGAGELTVELAKKVKKIYAFDYSDSMLSEAKKKAEQIGLKNIEFSQSDVLDISKLSINDEIDAIYCNGVIQYLSLDQFNDFISQSKHIIGEKGRIAIMNIPNGVFRDFYRMGVFHQKTYISFPKYIKGYLHLKVKDAINKLKSKKYISDGIGYWFTMPEVDQLAKKNELEVVSFHSKYPPFGYRFHSVFDKR